MPRAAKLKVFRTPIGFHDAYVAAPSQKAALAAWGSDGDLFARGEAEVVTDPALTAAPLAEPGKVIKRLRGTAAEQIAALPPDRPRPTRKPAGKPTSERKPPSVAKKPAPRPSRAALDKAEQAIDAAEAGFATARKALAAREKALADERRAMEKSQGEEAARLEEARHRQAEMYEAAVRKWRQEP